MKSSNSPRRIYSSKGTVVFCFGGKLFAPTPDTESTFRKNVPVTVEGVTEDGGLVVKQRKPHAKVLCETWYPLTAELHNHGGIKIVLALCKGSPKRSKMVSCGKLPRH
jgi:hypothetical protein